MTKINWTNKATETAFRLLGNDIGCVARINTHIDGLKQSRDLTAYKLGNYIRKNIHQYFIEDFAPEISYHQLAAEWLDMIGQPTVVKHKIIGVHIEHAGDHKIMSLIHYPARLVRKNYKFSVTHLKSILRCWGYQFTTLASHEETNITRVTYHIKY